MKYKLKSLLLFCVSGAMSAADAELVDYSSPRTLSESAISIQLKPILEGMEKHSEEGGVNEYQRLQTEKGLAPDDAITELCYSCTRTEFEDAVNVCKRNLTLALIRVKLKGRFSILERFSLDQAIQVALRSKE